MATNHLLPSTASAAIFFRALTAASAARTCPHAARNFSSSVFRKAASKRELYTAPAYRPHSMPDFPMPPRNDGIPDTSIAGPKPQLNDTRRPDQNVMQEAASISLPEREAQKSKPVPEQRSETVASSTVSTTKKPRKKLRPRKAAMNISADALEHLRELLEQDKKMIRVGVKNRGCSGLAYHLEYVDKANAFDEIVEQDGVKVLIDSKALFSIIGSEMDWQEDKLSARFVFKNPNITEQCGCVNHSDALVFVSSTLCKCSVDWIAIHIVIAIFLRLEFHYEAMRETTLWLISFAGVAKTRRNEPERLPDYYQHHQKTRLCMADHFSDVYTSLSN
ncbi:Iron-sulfur assembly protein 1 [Lithohypha guttulata]|uniref:Iron-sulfur assembly protein 1 n=1 Tax=Lithohypha guttulata TaxID=1690604 RepID=UPI00315D505E